MKAVIRVVTLMLVFCLILTGCRQKDGDTISVPSSQTITQTSIQITEQGTSDMLAEDFSQTPESLDETAWILEYDVGQTERAALFFKNGMVTYVSWDGICEDSYRYKNNILITDEINIGFVGTVDGAHITEVTYYGAPYPDLTRVDIPRAVQYATELRPEFVSPFDDDYPGLDFDTGDSGIMDGSNNGDGGNQDNSGMYNTTPRYENGQYVYIVAGKEIRLSVNVWDYTNIGSKRKSLDWKGLLEHYGYDRPNFTHSQYMSNDDWLRIEVGYEYRESYNASGGFHVSNASVVFIHTLDKDRSAGIAITVMEREPDYSEGYVFSIGGEPGDIICMILMAYAAEQLPNDPASDPFAELFSEYRIFNSGAIEYVIP